MLSVWAVVDTPSGWVAILFGAVAILAYLAAPPAEPPHYGLDHELSVAEPGFRRTMAGALGAFQGHYATDVPLLCAGTILILVPTLVIFVLFQRQIIVALLQGAVKE